jgi:hypothetical protein
MGCVYWRRVLRVPFSPLFGALDCEVEDGKLCVLGRSDIVLLLYVCWCGHQLGVGGLWVEGGEYAGT